MTSYLVRQRTREIGVRLALGADPARLVRTLTRKGLRWTAAGLGLGGTALASTQLLRSFLYGVGPTDPVAFLAVPLLLGATAYAACRIPASAVIQVDPLTICATNSRSPTRRTLDYRGTARHTDYLSVTDRNSH
jgi:putative ABC transport system permease protein